MQWLHYCTAAVTALAVSAGLAAQAPPAQQPSPGAATFTIFLRGVDVGREQVTLARSGSQWVVSSTGRTGDVTLNRFEVKYTADWQPTELSLEATVGDKEPKKIQLLTSFAVTTAINEITQNGVTNSKTDQISARTIVLPTNTFAGYEVLAARLASAPLGAEFPTYVAPSGELKVVLKTVADEEIKTPAGIVKMRKFELTAYNAGGSTFPLLVTVDDKARLARLEVAASGLTVVRNDLSGVAVRTLTARNPTDADVTIPANGFSIAATMTSPPGVGRLRHPAVVLVGGSGPIDREGIVAGIPVLSQLAGALAQQGFLVLRYDKRGLGQSGGRLEAATQKDYTDDLIGIVKWLEKRDDVDPRRLTVAGHSEGGTVALQAAAREKKITSLVLMATPGTTGADLLLEQQRHELDRLKLPEAEKAEKIELQRKIHAAVIDGTGWESVPPELRRQADTPWFRSLLMFDPSALMPRVKQPMLIIQGDLDTQVKPYHADKLAELARARKKDAGPVDVVHVPGVNHLLVPAATGDVQEYPDLNVKAVSPEVTTAIVEWLKKN
ncbi:MAG TPA: alpha/beta fold hydrolase [Vicinamibacterales bacterium]|nr:alpha/beta fold hydrolase [Vicinamibacterales bacterium]